MSDSNMDLIRSVWEEARDLIQRLEGSGWEGDLDSRDW